MKKPLALFLIINLFLTNLNAQSSLSSVIYDSINNILYSGDTIQLNCANPSIVLNKRIFAPGATNSYIVDSISYNPPCPYTISPTAIDYNILQDDMWGTLIDINFGLPASAPQFKFSFYGQNNLQFYVIGSNGILSFDQSVASGNDFMTNTSSRSACEWSLQKTPIPNPNLYKNCIFGPYHDIDFNAVNGVGQMYFQVIGEYPCRKFVLSFENVPMFACNSMRAYHMIVLYETTNVIEFYMQSKPLCINWNEGKAILGIQNADGTQATVVSNYNLPNQWTATNEAWRIRPNSQLSNSSKWFKRSLSSNIRTEVSSTNGSIVAFTDSIEGGQYYILETSFYALNGDTINITDSCLVLPQTSLANSQYGTTINASICNGETYSLNGFSENSTGTYSRLVQTINGCDSTITLNLLVDTMQTPTNLTINSDTNSIQLEWEGNGESYIIYRNEDSIGSTTQRLYIDTNVVQGINYCYRVKALNRICESELSIQICELIGLRDIVNNDISINLFPNPTEKETKLEIEGLTEDADVFVLDLNGRVLKTYKYSLNQKQLIIDVSGFAKGIYSIKVNNPNFNTVKKLVVN